MMIGAGATAAAVAVGAVYFVSRGDDAKSRCTAESGASAQPDPDWPGPEIGEVVNDQQCAIDRFTGYWDGDWGRIVIEIDGADNAVGTYDHDAGIIVGKVEDGILRGDWCESPSYAGDFDAGLFEMRVIVIDGVPSIDGRWVFGTDTSAGWSENWDVTGKAQEAPPAELTERLATARETCIGPN